MAQVSKGKERQHLISTQVKVHKGLAYHDAAQIEKCGLQGKV